MIVCHSVAGIEVLVATDGSITIFQDGPTHSAPEQVTLYPEHVTALIKALKDAKVKALEEEAKDA